MLVKDSGSSTTSSGSSMSSIMSSSSSLKNVIDSIKSGKVDNIYDIDGAPNPFSDGSPSDGGDGGNGLYYGYGSIGSGSSKPSAAQEKAAANLGAIVSENADNLRDKYENAMANLKIADEQNQSIRDANLRHAKQAAGSDWFRQHLKLQKVASAVTDRSSNALRGSFNSDFRDLLRTADDNIDSETLDTQRENVNSALLSYFESLAQNINSRNEMAADTESGLRELYADFLAQLNNIHPVLVEDKLDTENHSVRPTDWLSTDFYGSHVTQAAKPETQGLYRPDRANTTALSSGTRSQDTSRASAVMRGYWDRMDRGYDQRVQQA